MTALPEYIPFPLYHGTSTLWEDSIRMHGLGGRRIVEELRALEFHRRARACLRSAPEDWPAGTVLVMEEIEVQSVTATGFSFRHGGVYLTPSRRTALGYAIDNPLGSELLTHCRPLYEAHMSSGDAAARRWFEEYSELIEVLKRRGSPVLIRVDRIRTVDLTDESGNPEPMNLIWLLDLIAECEAESRQERDRAAALLMTRPRKAVLAREQIIEVIGQQVNFEASVTIPAADLGFEQIQDSGPLAVP